jgi:cytochrome P450
MIDLLSDEMRRDPFPAYDALRESAPVFRDPQTGAWLILDYEGVKRALFDHDAFSSAVTPPTGKAPDWLIFSDPPRHARLRAILLRAFTPSSVALLAPRVRELSRELLDETIERGEMDLVADYAGPLPAMVIAEMMGVPAADRPRLLRWSEAIVNLGHSAAGGATAERAVREHAAVRGEMKAYVVDLIEARRKAPEGDLMTRLVEAELDRERLTDEEILGFFQLLLAAGTETTTNVIDNGVLCFLESPAELARVEAAPELWPSAIEEIIRYRSPAQMMFREARHDVAMRGAVIPAGALVLAMIGAANRDPVQFRDAGRFDVARTPNPHLAFGHGIHFCLGAPLARLEAGIALRDLFARAKCLALASDAPWEPRRALHVHGPSRLPVRFEPGRRTGSPAR